MQTLPTTRWTGTPPAPKCKEPQYATGEAELCDAGTTVSNGSCVAISSTDSESCHCQDTGGGGSGGAGNNGQGGSANGGSSNDSLTTGGSGTGGDLGTGGAPATGGTPATGGAGTGGAPATGGSDTSGGSQGTGGSTGSGGNGGSELQRSLLSDPIAVTSEIQTQARLVADLGLTRLP